MQINTVTHNRTFVSNMYIISDGSEAVVVDPSVEYEEAKSLLDELCVSLKYIIVTHAHFDHILAIDSWVENTYAAVIVGKDDAVGLSDSNLNCYQAFRRKPGGYFGEYTAVSEGDVLKFGKCELSVMETPGHTPGSISLVLGGSIFVGDLVFANGGVGRTDLPGGDFSALVASIKRVLNMPDETVVYSGHGEKTTVREIKNFI